MDFIEIVALFLLNTIPVILLIIPYFFIRKNIAGKIYFRIMLGIMIFYLVYWILPIIFQVGTPPIELQLQTGEEGNIGLGIGYIIAHIGSLIALFAYYPLVTLPFIFCAAPLVSVIFVWNRIRKEKGSKRDILKTLTYNLADSPYRKIRDDLFKGNWSREKEILKLLIVLLPISLYLLQVLIKIVGLESVSITTGETALGWFIEILFAYLATFIFSLELLFSSQIALKGRYFGESIRQQTYKSLYTVGAPISILSIVLFIAEDIIGGTSSLPIIIYFFAYFIMASVIFILFLKIFEPISLLIFIKIIHWWKNRKEGTKNYGHKNFYYGIVFGCLAFLIWFAVNYLVFNSLFILMFADPESTIASSNFVPPAGVTLAQSLGFDVMNIFNFIALIAVSLIISTVVMKYCLKYIKKTFLGFITYLPTIIILSLLLANFMNPLITFSPETYWITGQSSFTRIFGFNFYTLRTASFNANLTGILGFLAIPYITTQYIFNIIIWSLMLFYMGKNFRAKNLIVDETHLEKAIFSSISDFLTYDEYIQAHSQYLISKNPEILGTNINQEREEIKLILNNLENDKLLDDLKPDDQQEKQRFYFTLKYLYNNNFIDILKPEFSYVFERVEKQGLYVIYGDGRDIFSYQFAEGMTQDPALISGMFSAITSFVKETTKSEDLLKKIDHGDITILIEYGKYLFTALFIKGNETAETRARLKEFVETFEAKYSDILVDWSGALIHFKEDHKLVEELFREV